MTLGMSEGAAIIAQLDTLDGGDPEVAHGVADDLLLESVPEEVRQAYVRLVRRCSWWGCA